MFLKNKTKTKSLLSSLIHHSLALYFLNFCLSLTFSFLYNVACNSLQTMTTQILQLGNNNLVYFSLWIAFLKTKFYFEPLHPQSCLETMHFFLYLSSQRYARLKWNSLQFFIAWSSLTLNLLLLSFCLFIFLGFEDCDV